MTFSIDEVCKKISPHNLLNSKKDANSLLCMGEVVKIIDFCKKEKKEKDFLIRGYIKDDKVICVSGESVYLKYQCQKPDEKKFCLSAKEGCHQLKQFYAFDLPLQYQAINEENLNCHYFHPNILKDTKHDMPKD